ncbi:homocysteine S-methyltransferase family protein [Adhaeribacter radiodurans]|uniref:Homocysteine S-methyltransferase family protein n=1 Tax=Adhaeribacter radiodurans TaxID=2745197 RepID=A0A7L7L3I5_9BACT|nr:homocysteine S-methyltransferase family protein [Adhaeribacter radiodurans]QMU27333.1 homocysteine S-methyltransferase family protein [Adhaeribacter radiodurans]
MIKYRTKLPQLGNDIFLTDGGLETTLVFLQGIELPFFAAFNLLKQETGKQVLRNYFRKYLTLAQEYKTGFILEAPTWRANKDWGTKLGYTTASLDQINSIAIAEMEALRDEFEKFHLPIVISGNIGPRGDGYVPSSIMTSSEAADYHSRQIETFSKTNADLVSAFTLNYTDEAIGIIQAAKKYQMPVVISFTVETDGSLPSGQLLKEAIQEADKATDNYSAYFMINCAHPHHFIHELQSRENWVSRIKGIRANASTKSHAELDESEHLDVGDKQELAHSYEQLKQLLPQLNVIGGCCGTDHTHLEKICTQLFHP